MGYLITGDAGLLEKLRAAETDFDQGVRSLRSGALVRNAPLVMRVEQASKDFTRQQEQLVEARQRGEDVQEIIRRFEMDL